MSGVKASLDESGTGFSLRGRLTRENVAELWARGREALAGRSRVDLDLQQVSMCDTAGVAMLVDWMRIARTYDLELRFHGAPEQMLAIARVSDLAHLLVDSEGRT